MAEGATSGDLGKTSTGIQPNVAGLLSYVLGLITGLIFFLIEKDNKFVKFHAMQSILGSAAIIVAGIVLAFIPILGVIIRMLLNLAGLVLWIVCMIKAYQGEWFRIPVIGDIAATQAGV